jgi:phospholipase/lecithinase/hemolysin
VRPAQEIKMQFRRFALFAAMLASMLALTSFASAAPFSNIFVYGDSLSDLGNIYKVSGGTIPLSPPYYNGRFS